jgi:hypothetical protein
MEVRIWKDIGEALQLVGGPLAIEQVTLEGGALRRIARIGAGHQVGNHRTIVRLAPGGLGE